MERVFSLIDDNKLPNMIFYGDSGIGKTTLCHIIIDEVLGENKLFDMILVNCSDKTGIDYIRTNIIDTARLKPKGDIRIFIMEESERLSPNAQDSLKKVLEHPYDKNNRFMFLTNNINKFIDAIIDRCRSFHFLRIRPKEMVDRLKYIATKEKIDISDEVILELAKSSNGSMRHPVVLLDELSSLNRKITKKDIKLTQELDKVKNVFIALKDKKIPLAKGLVYDMYQKGNNFFDIIRSFHDFTLKYLEKTTNFKIKAQCLVEIAKAEENVRSRCNEFLQMSSLLGKMGILLSNINNNIKKQTKKPTTKTTTKGR